MDLIYTDTKRKDVGVMQGYTLDLAFGSDENDFELVMDLNNHCCDTDCLVYIEGTEYGGIIDGYEVITKEDKLTYKGRTWSGILASHPTNTATLSGEANEIIGDLLTTYGLSDTFVTSTDDSGLVISGYELNAELDLYTNIMTMLGAVGGKLKFSFLENRVVISALPLVDYSHSEQFDNDDVEMQIEKTRDGIKVQFDLTDEDHPYDVGDIVGAKEVITDTTATAKITKKIVTISNGEVNIQYKVGE